jgi:ornithine cyclodeaminase
MEAQSMTTIPVISLETIQASLTEADILDAVKGALIAQARGEVNSPPPGMLMLDKPEGECHIKYGHLNGSDTFVIKIACGFYENPKMGLSASSGMMAVLSAKTGAPVCILDDKGWLTNVRTAAAGALAARAGAPSSVTTVGIIGTGEQAELQAKWTCNLLGIRSVTVYGRTASHVKDYVDRMRLEGYSVTVAPDIPALMKCCNLVITTTPSKAALILADDVKPGTHIVAMGADNPGKQELDAGLFPRAAVIMVDDHAQCVHHGDLGHAVRGGLVPENADIALGAVLAGENPGRMSEDDITIVDLTGIAAEDMAVAGLVWSRRG